MAESLTTAQADVALQANTDGVGAVERQLGEMLRQSAGTAEASTLVRARTLNLIVHASSPDQGNQAARVLDSFANTHPARAIILAEHRADLSPSPGTVSARVSTNCNRLGNRLICYEQIEVGASETPGSYAAGIVEPLLISHLPTCLWWMGEPRFSREDFRRLAAISDVVILDSQCFAEPETDLSELVDLLRRDDLIVADINWQRLLHWREMIAQLFAGAEGAEHLRDLRTVNVKCLGCHGMQAALLLGWLSSRLGWTIRNGRVVAPSIDRRQESESISVRIETGAGESGDLAMVSMTSFSSGSEGAFTVERTGEQVSVKVSGRGLPELTSTSHMPWPSDGDLLQCGLSLRIRDGIFEQAQIAAGPMLSLST